MNAASSGDADKVIQLISKNNGGTASAQTQTVTMSAADLGLPAGGSVVLRIEEIGFLATATADANGNVIFEVPLIQTNTYVTIELSVKDANGTVLWYGSDTQEVNGTGDLSISLTRQYWTLTPGSIAVSATSYSLLYDPATWTSDFTTLSVTGLEGAPAGASFTYEWKDESGNVIGTDPTLTQTVYQLYGSPAGAGSLPPGDITKTITVTVSYTDAGGTDAAADASADIALGGPVVLPTFSLNAAPPSNPADYDAANSNLSAPLFALTSRSAGIVITTDVTDFPAGTQFTLTVNGTAFPAQASPSWTVSLADLGYTDATAPTLASPASLSISCEASNTRAQVPESASCSASVCLVCTIPSFTISVTPPAYAAAKSDIAAKKYALADLDGNFSFTPVPAAGTSFPAGTAFTWTVVAGSASPSTLTPDTGVGESCMKSLSDFGLTDATIGRTSATATGITVSCTARNDHAAADRSADSDAALSAFLLYTLPTFTISVSLDTAGYNAGNSDLTGTVPLYALINMGKNFTLTATPDSGSFPADTEFEWTVRGTTLTGEAQKDRIITITPSAMGLTSTPGLANSVSTARTSPTSISIACKAKHASAVADVNGTAASASVYWLTIPAVKVTVSDSGGITPNASGVYFLGSSNLSPTPTSFKFKVEAAAAGDVIPNGVTYTWKVGTDPLGSGTDAAAYTEITKTLVQLGLSTLPSSETSKTVSCEVSLTGCTSRSGDVTVKFDAFTPSKLSEYIAGIDPATTSVLSPHTLPEIAITSPSDLTAIKNVLKNLDPATGPFVDLSATTIPSCITSLTDAFKNCETLVTPPVIPSDLNISSMYSCFSGCRNLTTAPTIPDSVTDMTSCFDNCRKLTAPPAIPAGVTSLYGCFNQCSELLTAPDLSTCANLTNMSSCFYYCTKLTAAPDLSACTSLQSLNGCFTGCSHMLTATDIPANVNDMTSCFQFCHSLNNVTITVNTTIVPSAKWQVAFGDIETDQHVTVIAPNPTVKGYITDPNRYNTGVAVNTP